jgi:heptosyltransferase-2
LDAVVTFDGNAGGPLKRPFAMRHSLKQGAFDMAVLLQNAFESAFTAWLAGIPVRVGFPTDLRGPLLTAKVPLTTDVRRNHQVFYYLAITDYIEQQWLGRQTARETDPDCSIALPEDAILRGQDLLASSGVDLHGRFVCLCPGSVNSEAKRWPQDSFAQLGDLLVERHGVQLVFLGAPGEQDLVEGIIAAMKSRGAVNLAGRANMIASMAVMQQSSLVISNDTGSAHLAVAASAKVLTIFGPTIPGATAPFGPNAHIIQGVADCAPCRHFRCPKPDHPCMRNSSPEAIAAKAEEIWDHPDTQPASVQSEREGKASGLAFQDMEPVSENDASHARVLQRSSIS